MPYREARAEHDRQIHPQPGVPSRPSRTGATAITGRPPGPGWTVVLRRQPARLVDGQPQGGYMDVYELICCDCGDDPDLDYRHASPGFQRIRGPYPFAEGIAAYGNHVRRHHPQATGLGESSAARSSS